eukprot:283105_1
MERRVRDHENSLEMNQDEPSTTKQRVDTFLAAIQEIISPGSELGASADLTAVHPPNIIVSYSNSDVVSASTAAVSSTSSIHHHAIDNDYFDHSFSRIEEYTPPIKSE